MGDVHANNYLYVVGVFYYCLPVVVFVFNFIIDKL